MKRKGKENEKEMLMNCMRKMFHTTSVALAENRFIKKYCGLQKLDPGRGGWGEIYNSPFSKKQKLEIRNHDKSNLVKNPTWVSL